MILRVHFYADPVLRKQCARIKEITPEIRQFVEDMIETTIHYDGFGFAAPQFGRLIRVFVARQATTLEDGSVELSTPKVYINPVLSNPAEEKDGMAEGCFSLPKLLVEVERPISITVEAQDIDGNTFKEELNGLSAKPIMHENDHLNGVLTIDRCSKEERKRIDPFLRELKKQYKHTYT